MNNMKVYPNFYSKAPFKLDCFLDILTNLKKCFIYFSPLEYAPAKELL